MDDELLVIHTIGSALLHAGVVIAAVWLLAGLLTAVDAWRSHDPQRSTRRR